MDNDVFYDLKQLDERLQEVVVLLGSCAKLFTTHYDARNFCWPYRIEGRPLDEKWGHYGADFPKTPRLSPITSAMCAWAVSKYLSSGNDAQSVPAEIPRSVAKKLARVPLSKWKSRTFTGKSEIFVRTEGLRFLASQAEWRNSLFLKLFRRIKKDVDEGMHKLESKTRHGPTERGELHSFFLYYYVLAIEQVREPMDRLAGSIHEISDLAKRIEDSKVRAWPALVSLLKPISELSENLNSFGLQVDSNLRRPNLAMRFRAYAETMREPIEYLITAISCDDRKKASRALYLVKRKLRSCRADMHRALTQLPLDTAGVSRGTLSWMSLSSTARKIKATNWYGDDLPERLREDVLSQISYAACGDFSRLDIGRMAYSLSAAVTCGSVDIGGPITKKALSIIFEHQRGGRWTQIQPIW